VQYQTAKTAARHWAQLMGELPGSVRAIDYLSVHLSHGQSTATYDQDRALERLDEFRYLTGCFLSACNQVGVIDFRSWMLARAVELTIQDVAGRANLSVRQMHRRLREVDAVVEDALIERDVLRGYGERDLLIEGGGPKARRIVGHTDYAAKAWADAHQSERRRA